MAARRPRLVRPLVLERCVPQPDGGGGQVVGWSAVTTLWCDVQPLSAREVLIGATVSSRVSHRILVRAVDPLSPRHPRAHDRLREGGRVFLISGVAAETAGRFLTIWAEEAPA